MASIRNLHVPPDYVIDRDGEAERAAGALRRAFWRGAVFGAVLAIAAVQLLGSGVAK